MKIICQKSALTAAVNTVLKAVPVRTTMPILECILIDASDGEISLTANDMELGIRTKVDGDVLEKGCIALEAKLFSEIVRKLPDNDVYIETDESFKALIKCEKAKFNIAAKPGEDFVSLPVVEKTNAIHISQMSLRDVIRQTIFSTSDNESNRLMAGELFDISGDQLKVVALDGQRIAIRRISLKESYDPVKMIVPGKTLNEISKILSDDLEDQMKIFFSSNHVLFEFGNTCVYSRLIEGEYFHVDNMLGGEPQLRTMVNKKDFLGCLERAELLIREGDNRGNLFY
jgi:DNA polymerase-3 subunit beta